MTCCIGRKVDRRITEAVEISVKPVIDGEYLYLQYIGRLLIYIWYERLSVLEGRFLGKVASNV